MVGGTGAAQKADTHDGEKEGEQTETRSASTGRGRSPRPKTPRGAAGRAPHAEGVARVELAAAAPAGWRGRRRSALGRQETGWASRSCRPFLASQIGHSARGVPEAAVRQPRDILQPEELNKRP